MGTRILTGYTGQKNITPSDDAAVHRAIFGESFILSCGENLEGNLKSVNEFEIADGLISIQGRIARHTRESFELATCPSGEKRIDYIVAEYNKDFDSQIETIDFKVKQGVSVSDSNEPMPPSTNIGNIDDGATTVDLPIFRILYNGQDVNFERLLDVVGNITELEKNNKQWKKVASSDVGWDMTANQSISWQETNWKTMRLIFSVAGKNFGWTSHEIPYEFAINHEGQPYSIALFSSMFYRNSTKYLRFYKNKITGTEENMKKGTLNGIVYDNSLQVLREVWLEV